MMNAMNHALGHSTAKPSKPSASQPHNQNSDLHSEEESYYHVGDRVIIPGGSVHSSTPRPSHHGSHAGTIAYVGNVDYSPGEFIGVILDEPVGKNNG